MKRERTQRKSGDKCPNCDEGVLAVYASRRFGKVQAQYMRCNRCTVILRHDAAAESVRRRS